MINNNLVVDSFIQKVNKDKGQLERLRILHNLTIKTTPYSLTNNNTNRDQYLAEQSKKFDLKNRNRVLFYETKKALLSGISNKLNIFMNDRRIFRREMMAINDLEELVNTITTMQF